MESFLKSIVEYSLGTVLFVISLKQKLPGLRSEVGLYEGIRASGYLVAYCGGGGYEPLPPIVFFSIKRGYIIESLWLEVARLHPHESRQLPAS